LLGGHTGESSGMPLDGTVLKLGEAFEGTIDPKAKLAAREKTIRLLVEILFIKIYYYWNRENVTV
jgi:hypothetical protein